MDELSVKTVSLSLGLYFTCFPAFYDDEVFSFTDVNEVIFYTELLYQRQDFSIFFLILIDKIECIFSWFNILVFKLIFGFLTLIGVLKNTEFYVLISNKEILELYFYNKLLI